jgi:hypothetical protein
MRILFWVAKDTNVYALCQVQLHGDSRPRGKLCSHLTSKSHTISYQYLKSNSYD